MKMNAIAALFGLGYIIGFRYSAIICAGSFVSWFILVPALWYFGQHIDIAIAPSTIPISSMTATEIFRNYVRHIGIGGIACAGIIGIIKNLKVIVSAFSLGFKEIFSGKKAAGKVERTDRDLRMSTILGIIGVTAVALFVFFLFFLGTRPVFLERLYGGPDGMQVLSVMYELKDFTLTDGETVSQVISKKGTP